MKDKRDECRITIVFDNYRARSGLETDWGFACVVETPRDKVLFDTGGSGDILLRNMNKLGMDPSGITAVVLSHAHGDHTGGLRMFLQENPRVPVYMGSTFPRSLKSLPGSTVVVEKPGNLFGVFYTTGEMGGSIREQSLIIDASEGLIVITGCAHPGIVHIVERAREILPGKKIHLVMGGFHLLSTPPAKLEKMCFQLRSLGVANTAPSHCSGDRCRSLFSAQYGEHFIQSGVGSVFSFSINEEQ